MENAEETLDQLTHFDKNPITDIPQSLEDYLVNIAKSGHTQYPWVKIKTLFKVKLENVIADFIAISPVENVPAMPNVEEFKFEEMKSRVFEQLESYTGIPFTIQRLCELLTQPTKNYKRIDTFLRALVKVMTVVSTIPPFPVPAGSWSGISNGFGESTINLGQEPSASTGCSRRMVDSLESPAKRMRLSIEEDGGPCDSADQVPLPVQNGSPPGNECIGVVPLNGLASDPSTSASALVGLNLQPVDNPATDSSEPSESASHVTEDNMEIDSECTSSQARIELSSGLPEKELSGTDVDTAELQTGNSGEAESGVKDCCEAESDLDESREAEPEVQDDRTETEPLQAKSSASADQMDDGAVGNAVAVNSGEEPATAGETDGTAAAAMDIECGAREGISTSGESSSTNPVQQVEDNSEAEASTGDKELSEETLHDEDKTKDMPHETDEEEDTVCSSQSQSESRLEDIVGVADSSDEAEHSRPRQLEVDGEADQSESANTTPASGAAVVATANTVAITTSPAAAGAEAGIVTEAATEAATTVDNVAATEASSQSEAVASEDPAENSEIGANAVVSEMPSENTKEATDDSPDQS